MKSTLLKKMRNTYTHFIALCAISAAFSYAQSDHYFQDQQHTLRIAHTHHAESKHVIDELSLHANDRHIATITYQCHAMHGCKIIHLFVDEAYRKHGYGRMLVRYALDEMHAHRYENWLVIVQSTPSAVRFYQKLGFVISIDYDPEESAHITLELDLAARGSENSHTVADEDVQE